VRIWHSSKRRHRASMLAVTQPLVLLAGAFFAPAVLGATPSPHFFAPTSTNCLTYGDGTRTCTYHNDTGSVYADLPGQGVWWTWKWPSTSTTFYSGLFKFDSSFPSAWRTAARAAVTQWNNQPYYSPLMSETTGSTYDIIFKYSSTSACSGVVWYACATVATGSTASKSQAEAQQFWTITFNTAYSFGVGTTGSFDVQSILTNELGHAWYLNHNPSWTSGVVQLQSCKWGTTTCRDSVGGTVTCTNCGNRHTVLSGDQMTLDHIYGHLPTVSCPRCLAGTQGPPKQAGTPNTPSTPNDERPIAASFAIADGP
jgi:hypothetical protein